MNIPLRHCQFLLVAGYVSFNVAAYADSVATGMLSGDFAGFRAPSVSAGLLLVVAVALSYALVMFPMFDGLRRVGRFKQARSGSVKQPTSIHWLVLLLSVFQLLFALSTGVGVAGTFAKTDNPLRFIIYIVPIDLLALIYLAVSDNGKLYKANLAVYLLSSLTRGWSFGLAFLLGIAVIRSNGVRITLSRLLAWLMFLAIVAPVILWLRFFVREDGVDVSEVLYYTDLVLDGRNVYLYILGFVAERLQHFTSVAHIFVNREVISAAVAAGEIRPFYFDGTIVPPLAALLGQKIPLELNSWLTAYYHGLDFEAVAYNTHIGFIGRPILEPALLPVYVAFVAGLGLGSLLLSRAIGSKFVIELTWLMWMLFLCAACADATLRTWL